MINQNQTIYGLEYSWKLTGLRKVDTNELGDVIIGTNWTLSGTDENGVSGSFTGATPFKIEDLNPNTFTEYNELSEEDVLNWIKDQVVSYWDHINAQILKQIRDNASVVVDVDEDNLPWSTPSGSVIAVNDI